MNERPMRIAVSIKDRAAQQLVSNLFSTAGASIQVCDDAAAIIAAAPDIQAVVLGLSAAPEKTFDALVVLRQKLATIPIYVISDAAGERHAKRATRFGATQVVSQELLPRRVGHLLQQLTPAPAPAPIPAPIRSPGWAGGQADPAYEIQSMDLGSWLSIPGNRRLLGMEEPDAAGTTPDSGPAHEDTRPGSDQSKPTPMSEGAPPAASPPQGVGAAPSRGGDSASDSLADCPHVARCRTQYEGQSAAIMEVDLQREKRLHDLELKLRERLQSDIKHELAQQIATEDAHVKDLIAAALAGVRREIATAVNHVYLMVIALICAVVLAGLGMTWRLGLW